mgnify:CR=1 FL=1
MDSGYNEDLNPQISAVIASVGDRPSIIKTIDSLRNTIDRLLEIIIVLPPKIRIPDFLINEMTCSSIPILVIESPTRGQVQQRQHGVSRANAKYVIYCDDDIELTSRLPEIAPNFVIAPVFVDSRHRVMTRRLPFQDTVAAYFFAKLTGCYWSEGRVSVFGFGLPFSYRGKRHLLGSNVYIEREWLPGGCIVFPRDLFPKDNYYPFSGYAYGEDVALSLTLRSRGLVLAHALAFQACLGDSPELQAKKTLHNRIFFYIRHIKILYFLITLRKTIFK